MVPDTAASRVGLVAGDVVHRIDREDTASVAEVVHVLGHRCAGETVTLAIERNGTLIEVSVELGPRPPD